MRQSFIFGPLAVRKRFSVPRLLMAPPIVPPDLGEEERKRFGRVRKLEITNCFYFSLTVRATSEGTVTLSFHALILDLLSFATINSLTEIRVVV